MEITSGVCGKEFTASAGGNDVSVDNGTTERNGITVDGTTKSKPTDYRTVESGTAGIDDNKIDTEIDFNPEKAMLKTWNM